MFLNFYFITSCLLCVNLQAASIIKLGYMNNLQLGTSSIQRRQTSTSSSNSFQLTEEHISELEKSKIETKEKLEAVVNAGGKITPEEISIAFKKAISENIDSDHKVTGKAIKKEVESLADQKLTELKGTPTKSSTQQRRQSPKSSSYTTEEDKLGIAKSRAETKAKIDSVIAAGGEITAEEISIVSKKAILDNENNDRKTIGIAIKIAVEDLADRKLAELKNHPTTTESHVQRLQNSSSSGSLQLKDEEKSSVEKSKINTKDKLKAVVTAGGKITPEEISTAVKNAISENIDSDHKVTGKAIETEVERLADKKLAEVISGSS